MNSYHIAHPMDTKYRSAVFSVTGILIVVVFLTVIVAVHYEKINWETSQKTKKTFTAVGPTSTITPNTNTLTATIDNTHIPDTVGKSVIIKNSTYTPASLSIKTNQIVVWTNQDTSIHNIDFTDGTLSSGLFNGDSYSRIFPTSGTFNYKSDDNPQMTGTIVVSN